MNMQPHVCISNHKFRSVFIQSPVRFHSNFVDVANDNEDDSIGYDRHVLT